VRTVLSANREIYRDSLARRAQFSVRCIRNGQLSLFCWRLEQGFLTCHQGMRLAVPDCRSYKKLSPVAFQPCLSRARSE
jgi:hypothetical protein